MRISSIIITLCVVAVAFVAIAPSFADARLTTCGGSGQPQCQLCDVFKLGNNIFTFLLFPAADINNGIPVVPLLAGFFVLLAGFYLLMGGANPSMHAQGKSVLLAVIMGLVIVYTSWVIIQSILTFMGVAEWAGVQNWWQITCTEPAAPITSPSPTPTLPTPAPPGQSPTPAPSPFPFPTPPSTPPGPTPPISSPTPVPSIPVPAPAPVNPEMLTFTINGKSSDTLNPDTQSAFTLAWDFKGRNGVCNAVTLKKIGETFVFFPFFDQWKGSKSVKGETLMNRGALPALSTYAFSLDCGTNGQISSESVSKRVTLEIQNFSKDD